MADRERLIELLQDCVDENVETKRYMGSTSVKFGGEIMQQGRKEAIEAWNRRAEDGK